MRDKGAVLIGHMICAASGFIMGLLATWIF